MSLSLCHSVTIETISFFIKAEKNYTVLGLLWWLSGKSTCQGRRPGFAPWVGKIPWRRKWQPTPVFLPGKFPWTGEPGRLQSMGSQRVGHDWTTSLSYIYIYYKMLYICTHSIFLIHLVTDRCLVCFPILATVNSWYEHRSVDIFLKSFISFGYIPSSETAESRGSSIFNFLRKKPSYYFP